MFSNQPNPEEKMRNILSSAFPKAKSIEVVDVSGEKRCSLEVDTSVEWSEIMIDPMINLFRLSSYNVGSLQNSSRQDILVDKKTI